MLYGYIGSMRVKPGHRDDVAAILVGAAAGLRELGCQLYVVSLSESDDDVIWVSEVWLTKQEHDASLQTAEARETIDRAMPMLTGEFTSQELTVAGGLGV
jgi:quinol monooxygenase YgiN